MGLTRIYSTSDPEEIEFMAMILRDHGIEAQIENSNAAALAGLVPTPAVPFVIAVQDSDAERAKALIAEELDRRRGASAEMIELTCACGKGLEVPKAAGLERFECPYCGASIDVPPIS